MFALSKKKTYYVPEADTERFVACVSEVGRRCYHINCTNIAILEKLDALLDLLKKRGDAEPR